MNNYFISYMDRPVFDLNKLTFNSRFMQSKRLVYVEGRFNNKYNIQVMKINKIPKDKEKGKFKILEIYKEFNRTL